MQSVRQQEALNAAREQAAKLQQQLAEERQRMHNLVDHCWELEHCQLAAADMAAADTAARLASQVEELKAKLSAKDQEVCVPQSWCKAFHSMFCLSPLNAYTKISGLGVQ